MKRKSLWAVCFLVAVLAINPSMATDSGPNEVVTPEPRLDNEGEFLCPFTQDDVLAEWTDKSVKAAAAARIGSAIGTALGQEATKSIPIIGGWLGGMAGKSAARKIAIKNAGGMEFIKATSDISFDDPDKLAVYIFANYSTTEHYEEALKAVFAVYPKVQKTYHKSIKRASKAFSKAGN